MAVTEAVLEWSTGRVGFLTDPGPAPRARYIVTDIAGWYGGVGVSGETSTRIGHGVIAGRKWRTQRALTLKGHVEVTDPAERDRVMRELSGVLWSGLEGTLTATVDGLTLSCPVTLDGEPGIVPFGVSSVTVQLPLTSSDPWLFGEERTVFLRPVGSGIGLEYPLFGGGALRYGTAIAADDTVTNGGTATAYPSYLVVGDLPGGFRITEGGRTVEWPWPVVMEAPVQIESTGSVWIGEANVTARATIRQWMPIEAGATIAPRLYALQGGDGWCEVHQRDTYI